MKFKKSKPMSKTKKHQHSVGKKQKEIYYEKGTAGKPSVCTGTSNHILLSGKASRYLAQAGIKM